MSTERRRIGWRWAAVAGLTVLAACGDGGSILEAGNPDVPATPAPVRTVPVSAAPGETLAPTIPTTTTLPPSTTAAPLANLPKCPTAALASTTGTTDVVFWHGMTGALDDTLVALTDAYNASQTKVHVTLQNQGSYEQTIDKFVQSDQGSRPDMVQTPEYAFQLMRDTKALIPAGACMESSKFDTKDFLPRALSYYATEGVQWSMPFNVSNPVLYYNKVIFAKAGLDPEKPPLSLDELRADSEKIVASGAAASGVALDTGFDSGGGWFLEQWFSKLGIPYADNGNGRLAPATKVLIDNPKAAELLAFIAKMIADGLAVNVGDNVSGQDNFLKMADPAQPAAMTIGTSAALGTLLPILRSGLIPGVTENDIGVGPLPGPNGAPGINVGGASLWVVDGHGDAKSAAVWDYMTYLLTAQSQATWAAKTGYVPLRSGALDLDPLKSIYASDPRFKVSYDQLVAAGDDPTAVGPILGPLREVRLVVAKAVATIFGGADAQATMSQAALDATALVADYVARNAGG